MAGSLDQSSKILLTSSNIYCHQQSNANMAFVLYLITMSSPKGRQKLYSLPRHLYKLINIYCSVSRNFTTPCLILTPAISMRRGVHVLSYRVVLFNKRRYDDV